MGLMCSKGGFFLRPLSEKRYVALTVIVSDVFESLIHCPRMESRLTPASY